MKKNILRVVAFAGLVLTILPSVSAFNGVITLQANYGWMFLGMVLWFVAAGWLMNSKQTG